MSKVPGVDQVLKLTEIGEDEDDRRQHRTEFKTRSRLAMSQLDGT